VAAVDGWTAGSAGPIQIPVCPYWIHIGATGADDADADANDDLSASSRRSRINHTSD